MRYPRNVKIFRGQLDMAPLANVLFLLLIFILLASLVYAPGIPFHLSQDFHGNSGLRKILTIAQNGNILFEGKTNRVDELEQLRAELKKLPPQSVVVLKVETNAPKELIIYVQKQVAGLPITLETPQMPIELPTAEGFSGTPNPTVVVAVNFGGQLFYENKLVLMDDLKSKLQAAVKQSREPLTLLVLADASVQHGVLVQLAELARANGIKDMMQVVKPAKP
jgi:biopolymer transport protein ExbD